jgi:hypothetical protein
MTVEELRDQAYEIAIDAYTLAVQAQQNLVDQYVAEELERKSAKFLALLDPQAYGDLVSEEVK